MDRESYERAGDLDSVPGTRLPTGRDLSMGELRALFEVCAADPSPVGRRDAALFALLREGLRRAEAAALQLEQLDLEAAEVRVIGKRDQERLVPLQPGAIAALRDWLACREAQLGPQSTGPLLLRLRKPRRDGTAQILPHSLTAVTVNQRVERRGREAAVARLTPPRLAPHLRGRRPRSLRGSVDRAAAGRPRLAQHDFEVRSPAGRRPATCRWWAPRALRGAGYATSAAK